jgi:catechol 2,3-dioxygenase-like lactoylglutathione lyase family enzyme
LRGKTFYFERRAIVANIDHVHIHASDPAKTIEFFEGFFGARVIQEFEALGRKLTIMSLGDKSKLSILHIPPAVEKPKPERASIDHIGIAVEDIEGLVDRLKEGGFAFPVDLTRSSSGAKIAFCLGPDNVYLELIERP